MFDSSLQEEKAALVSDLVWPVLRLQPLILASERAICRSSHLAHPLPGGIAFHALAAYPFTIPPMENGQAWTATNAPSQKEWIFSRFPPFFQPDVDAGGGGNGAGRSPERTRLHFKMERNG